VITVEKLKRLAPSAAPDLIQAVADGWREMDAAGINTPLRACHFLAQICVETGGFRSIEENLTYSAQRLNKVWPKRFPTVASAKPYANNPQALAAKVYGGRLGNKTPQDAWDYRGSGFIQTTGKSNFAAVGYADDPDQLREPGPGFSAAVAYWKQKGLSTLADRDDLVEIRRRVNGGTHGLEDARRYLAKAKSIWMAERQSLGLLAMDDDASNEAAEIIDPDSDDDAIDEQALPEREIRSLQERLQSLGYHEVGIIDGCWGSRTVAALTAFKHDNGLPIDAELDDPTYRALATAPPRKIDPVRANLTTKDVAKESTIVKAAQQGRIWSVVQGAFASLAAMAYGIKDNISDAIDHLGPLKTILTDVPPWAWAAGGVGLAFVIWKGQTKVIQERVQGAREGRLM
jgi:putative chitinase